MEIYLVGGAVRDQLLNRQVIEKDWVIVGATPDQLLKQGYQQVGKDFPIFLHPQTKEEYALARTERKTGPGYTGFQFDTNQNVSLEDDLRRRDLTINAMAQDQQGQIIDPYGGQEDLNNRILRHVSDAFTEDPLRVLRIARFAARYHHYGFKIAESTQNLMHTMVTSGDLNNLVAERIWKECQRALTEDTPQILFQVLRDCGALKILFPEIDVLFGIPNPAKWHPEIDSGIHTLMVLEQAAKLTPDPLVRFAALTHDLGKAATPKDKWPSHHGHEKLGLPIIAQLCRRLRVPTEYQRLAELVSEYHLHCHKAQELKASTLLDILHALDCFRRPERLEQFLLACEADARGRTGYEDRDYPAADYFRSVYQIALTVDVKEIINDGFMHKAIQKELRQRRMRKIKRYQKSVIESLK